MPKSSSSGSTVQNPKARKKQIEKLRQLKLNVTILQTDVQYKVEFPVKFENTNVIYSITINLPPSFPNEPPVLFVQPPCSHQKLDAAQSVVNLPALDNFRKKPDLSSVVKHLVYEFEKNPPIPLVLNDFEHREQENILRSYTASSPDVKASTKSVQQSLPDVDRPAGLSDFHDTLPDLKELSIEELRDLDTDEMQLLALIQSTEHIKSISKQREEISQRVESIANENLCMSKNLSQLQDQLLTKYKICQELKAEYEKNISRFSEATEWMNLQNLSLTMQVSAAEQEQAAEKLVEDFLEGNNDVALFTKEYLKSKKLATIRKVKEDKIQHMLLSS